MFRFAFNFDLFSDSELTRARDIVNRHKSGENTGLSVAALWNEKYKYDSAYHPESGQKMFLPGRMSAWVPANMCITGAMLAFQKTPGQIIFWQFANQSVNAAVNFTNRSGGDEIPTTTLACNFVGATTLAVGVAMGVKRFAPKYVSNQLESVLSLYFSGVYRVCHLFSPSAPPIASTRP